MSFLVDLGHSSILFLLISLMLFLSPPKTSGSSNILLANIQSHFFSSNFFLAFCIKLSVSAAKPITSLGLLFPALEILSNISGEIENLISGFKVLFFLIL